MSADRSARMRHRAEARERIIAAAHQLLESQPWPEVTVEQLAHAADLSRTAFYQHFTDRQHLLLTLFEALAQDLGHVGDDWMQSGLDPAAEHRRSLAALTAAFQKHGRLLQAVSDAAATDADVAAAYEDLAEGIVSATTAGIERDITNGHTRVDDPEQMSRALSALMERYLLRSYGRPPYPDPNVVTDTLATIWIRTLYADVINGPTTSP